MPAPNKRNHTFRKVKKITPSGENKIFYSRRAPSKAKCGSCGVVLSGVSAKRPSKLTKMSKTKKRPDRTYGGVLCSKCTKKVLIVKARV